jgi:hypothetical protein
MNFPKTQKQFYTFIGNLLTLGLFLEENKLFSKPKCQSKKCVNKPNHLSLVEEKDNLKYRCTRCGSFYYIKSNLFTLVSSRNISIQKILELIWHWSNKQTNKFITKNLDLNSKTVRLWINKIRQLLFNKLMYSKPMGGPGYRVQIDESLFRGRRKYNRGRLLLGDKKKYDNNDSVSQTTSKRNYGKLVNGPWVFGLVCQKISDINKLKNAKLIKQKRINNYIKKNFSNKHVRRNLYRDKRKLNTKATRIYNNNTRSYVYKFSNSLISAIPSEVRMFRVEKRDYKSLLPIILCNVAPGTEIVSDEWKAYIHIDKLGYKHYTVNHSENFVNPKTKRHTQLIECLWLHAKNRIMRGRKGN